MSGSFHLSDIGVEEPPGPLRLPTGETHTYKRGESRRIKPRVASARSHSSSRVCAALTAVDAKELEKGQFVLQQCDPAEVAYDRSDTGISAAAGGRQGSCASRRLFARNQRLRTPKRVLLVAWLLLFLPASLIATRLASAPAATRVRMRCRSRGTRARAPGASGAASASKASSSTSRASTSYASFYSSSTSRIRDEPNQTQPKPHQQPQPQRQHPPTRITHIRMRHKLHTRHPRLLLLQPHLPRPQPPHRAQIWLDDPLQLPRSLLPLLPLPQRQRQRQRPQPQPRRCA